VANVSRVEGPISRGRADCSPRLLRRRRGREPRYYQRNAINASIEAIANGQDRLLLVMATGTGKTYTAFQIIWRLWKAGRKKRVLYLADRNVLIDQTQRSN
jgi:type I site-specific restriction endonuclease